MISRRRHRPISTEHAKLIVGTVCPEMAPLVVRPEAGRGAPVTYEIRLRGNGALRHSGRDGTAEVRAAGSAADCVISPDPLTYCWSSTGGCRCARHAARRGAGVGSPSVAGVALQKPVLQSLTPESKSPAYEAR